MGEGGTSPRYTMRTRWSARVGVGNIRAALIVSFFEQRIWGWGEEGDVRHGVRRGWNGRAGSGRDRGGIGARGSRLWDGPPGPSALTSSYRGGRETYRGMCMAVDQISNVGLTACTGSIKRATRFRTVLLKHLPQQLDRFRPSRRESRVIQSFEAIIHLLKRTT